MTRCYICGSTEKYTMSLLQQERLPIEEDSLYFEDIHGDSWVLCDKCYSFNLKAVNVCAGLLVDRFNPSLFSLLLKERIHSENKQRENHL